MTRTIIHRTRGHGHGPIGRLMSPSDLGERLKPFLLLDLFEADTAAYKFWADQGRGVA